jgi:hypothetical protein
LPENAGKHTGDKIYLTKNESPKTDFKIRLTGDEILSRINENHLTGNNICFTGNTSKSHGK